MLIETSPFRCCAGRTTAVLTAVASALAFAGSAAAKPPAGWTAAQASARSAPIVKVGWCKAYRTDTTNCAAGKPTTATGHELVKVANVTCFGGHPGRTANPKIFTQFSCEWEGTNNIGGDGKFTLYVTGPTTFRWKSL